MILRRGIAHGLCCPNRTISPKHRANWGSQRRGTLLGSVDFGSASNVNFLASLPEGGAPKGRKESPHFRRLLEGAVTASEAGFGVVTEGVALL